MIVSSALTNIFFKAWEIFSLETSSFFHYFINELTFNVNPWYVNYFWWLILLSLFIWGLEILFPWRKKQPILRKDFFLDLFYLLFNFYLFKIIVFYGFSVLAEKTFNLIIGGKENLILFDTTTFNPILQVIIFFVFLDFIQYITHRILHHFSFLWEFHKVHHSVEQMGFAAHFRYHWMENVFYTPMKYISMMLIGNFSPDQAFLVYYISIAIGHLNHANINLSYGPLKYIFNNPKMHIWHHTKKLPEKFNKGVNFGISLSIWDYIFKTNYIPTTGKDNELGFTNSENFPKSFLNQFIHGFKKTKEDS